MKNDLIWAKDPKSFNRCVKQALNDHQLHYPLSSHLFSFINNNNNSQRKGSS